MRSTPGTPATPFPCKHCPNMSFVEKLDDESMKVFNEASLRPYSYVGLRRAGRTVPRTPRGKGNAFFVPLLFLTGPACPPSLPRPPSASSCCSAARHTGWSLRLPRANGNAAAVPSAALFLADRPAAALPLGPGAPLRLEHRYTNTGSSACSS